MEPVSQKNALTFFTEPWKFANPKSKNLLAEKVGFITLAIIAVIALGIIIPLVTCWAIKLSKNNQEIEAHRTPLDKKEVPTPPTTANYLEGATTSFEASADVSNSFKPPVPQLRRFPPMGANDNPNHLEMMNKWSKTPGGQLFYDEEFLASYVNKRNLELSIEIIEKLDIIKRECIGLRGFFYNEGPRPPEKIYAFFTKNNKAIIQQQGIRSCTATASAMLIFDRGGKIDLESTQQRDLGNTEQVLGDIKKAGFDSVVTNVNYGPEKLKELKKLIEENGSCIVAIDGNIGGHVVVVDEVSKDLSKVRLRDSFHGWEITLTAEAFLKTWSGGEVIQIKN